MFSGKETRVKIIKKGVTMYVPNSGDMNYIIAGSEAMYNSYSKFISRIVKKFKGKQMPANGKRFRNFSLNNA